MTPPLRELPPVGSRVIVWHGNLWCGNHVLPREALTGTVTRHVGGWLAEVEIPGKAEPGLYAPEGMRQC